MRYSRLTARDEVAVNAGSSLENVLSNQYRAKARRQIREKIERLLWLIFSLTTIWYGDGKINLVTWLYNRYSAVRTWFLLALFAISANGIILMYLIHRHDLHRKGSRWESQASWAVPTSCCLGFVSFVGFGAVLWPIYSWVTPIAEVVLCMGLLMSSYFVPSLKQLPQKLS